jgi:1-acyl-sn-glycerol-3-phosphate acyltransferase
MRSRLYAIVSVPLFGILYCVTAIGVFITLILAWLNLKRPVRRLTQIWAKLVFLIIGKRFRVYGKENIARGEKYILIANHSSLFDIVAIQSFYPDISWFGHERLLKVPLFNKILKMTDYVPFKEPTYRNTREMIGQLTTKSELRTVAIFPEGTRTLNGKMNTFYRGFIYLLRTREIDILPVTLNGFYKLKPKNRSYINFDARLEVIIHKPVKREAIIHKNDSEIIETLKTIIESAYR